MISVIYGLYHPETDELRYVGKTDQPLNKRLSRHIRDALEEGSTYRQRWIYRLLDLGDRPEIRMIWICPRKTWRFWEVLLIRKFKEWGYRLTNTNAGGGGSRDAPRPKKNWDQLSEGAKRRILRGAHIENGSWEVARYSHLRKDWDQLSKTGKNNIMKRAHQRNGTLEAYLCSRISKEWSQLSTTQKIRIVNAAYREDEERLNGTIE